MAAIWPGKAFIFHALGRGIALQIINGQFFCNPVSIPFFNRDIEGMAIFNMFLHKIIFRGFHHQTAALLEFSQFMALMQPQIFCPVAPVMIALPRKGCPVKGRIMHTDNCTGTGCRAMPYLAIAIHRQGFIAALGQLKGGSTANNTCPDNNNICILCHICLL